MADDQIVVPTAVRLLNQREWEVVTRVFTAGRLPWRQRIVVSNGLGGGGAPFTIPTSLIPAAFGAAATAALTRNPALSFMVGAAGYLGSVMNLGYIMNVGPAFDHDMSTHDPSTLVHETCHVWQGRNSIFAITYVINSVTHQCAGMMREGKFDGRNAAYFATPGQPWGNYSAEQQAWMVEQWFIEGEKEDSPYYTYIQNHIRTGRA